MANSSLLTAVFPLVDGKLLQVGDLIKDFDFSKINVKQERSRDDYLHFGLAPSFGELSSETIQKLDDEIKIMIAVITKQLVQIPPEGRNWDDIVSLCSQSPVLDLVDDGRVDKIDNFTRNASSDFKTDGSPDGNIVKEFNTWFKQLVVDEDVLSGTKMNADVLGRIVAQTGVIIEDFDSFFDKRERHDQNVVDIGVIQYPDVRNPDLKIYRIQLTVWSDCSRTLIRHDDQHGIQGEFNARRFKPRSELISRLSTNVKQQAMSAAENLFNF
ncbi:hypothetical protein CEP54_006590 [Fusarium duplospermum]|uniref:Uncharacterized protein n=1 Tax=Fusarium duplospermum TaxID=1325734 RepID=A0A428Q631_9HYPO|nr:hypothetical protein CEP54_006590 [Fusarium duplospermum]